MAEGGSKSALEHVGVLVGVAVAVAGLTAYTVSLQFTLNQANREIERLSKQVDTLNSEVQESAKVGPQGPKGDKGELGERGSPGLDGQAANSGRLDEMSRQIGDLNRRLAAVATVPSPTNSAHSENQNSSAGTPSSGRTELLGTWIGTVGCPVLHFSIVFTIKSQTGRIGSGTWEWEGSNKGSSSATLGPNPTAEKPDGFMLVPAGNSAYSYNATVNGNEINGQSTQGKCNLHLEKG